MSEENIPFYTKINKKKLKKGPILRVQFKKFQPIFTSKSTTNINRNIINLKIPQITRRTIENDSLKQYFYKNRIKKYNSSKYLPKHETDKYKIRKKSNEINTLDKIKDNNLTKYQKKKVKKLNEIKNNFNDENIIKNYNDKSEMELYCRNCINKKLNLKKNLTKYMNSNNSYDFNLHENITLKQLDEDYITDKIIQNERRQLAAFNYLKAYQDKNPKSNKDKLQYINENSEYPFIGLNLQDYLYYNNKKRNEKINKLVIKNISSYNLSQPRKEINDYYNKVMFQAPLLEKDYRPSNKYKMKYIETLQKQIDEDKKLKLNKKKEEQKKEKTEINKYNELFLKIDAERRNKNMVKYNLIKENNNNMNKIKKEKDESNRKEDIHIYQNRLRKLKERENEYKTFINQQRLNEINNLQNWIDENMKQKREQMNKKEKEDMRWKKYLKQMTDSFHDYSQADKCAECNIIYTNRLYPLQV